MSMMQSMWDDPGTNWPMSGRRHWGGRQPRRWNQLSWLEDTMMDMDRQLMEMERDMGQCMRNLGITRPWAGQLTGPSTAGQLGWTGPSTESETGIEGRGDQKKYAMNIHLGGNISPEGVKVSLKDHVMTVEAKKEFKSDDGHARCYQEFMRKFILPENIDMKEVKSVLTPEGYLKIEAPMPHGALPEAKKPHAIPIKTE